MEREGGGGGGNGLGEVRMLGGVFDLDDGLFLVLEFGFGEWLRGGGGLIGVRVGSVCVPGGRDGM